jgi:DNA-binding HxlR family transcriptional regulator
MPRKGMPAVVHLAKGQWKLLVIYTLQKENLKVSGLFTASGLTIIESDSW